MDIPDIILVVWMVIIISFFVLLAVKTINDTKTREGEREQSREKEREIYREETKKLNEFRNAYIYRILYINQKTDKVVWNHVLRRSDVLGAYLKPAVVPELDLTVELYDDDKLVIEGIVEGIVMINKTKTHEKTESGRIIDIEIEWQIYINPKEETPVTDENNEVKPIE